MDILSNEIIIKRLQSTVEQEVNQIMRYLYERVYPSVRRLVTNNKGTESDVPDIFQDGLIILYNLALQKKINHETKIEGYLYSICRNLWLKTLKKKRKTVELTEERKVIPTEDFSIKYYHSEEQKAIFESLLAQLGTECQTLLNYFYYDRRKMKDIAPLMNFSSEQVAKNKKSKCMKKLRELIESKNINRDLFY